MGGPHLAELTLLSTDTSLALTGWWWVTWAQLMHRRRFPRQGQDAMAERPPRSRDNHSCRVVVGAPGHSGEGGERESESSASASASASAPPSVCVSPSLPSVCHRQAHSCCAKKKRKLLAGPHNIILAIFF
jgi:hypothetical protein